MTALHHPFLLSVLDPTAIGPLVDVAQAFRWTVEAAKMAEDAGFHRFWVVEHHGMPDIGGCRPALLVAHLAAHTRSIRLGAGGVMLPNHAPWIVAEEFLNLEALCPRRIDLGVCRTGPHDALKDQALRRVSDSPADFEGQLTELKGFLTGHFPDGHPFATIRHPLRLPAPPTFLLGSSRGSALMAAAHGLAFGFAHHLVPADSADTLAAYRQHFQPSENQPQPHALITVAVVCAETLEAAEHAAFQAMIPKIRRGLASQLGIQVSDAVLAFPEWAPQEISSMRDEFDKDWVYVGTPDMVKAQLLDLQARTGADELMLTTIEYDGPSRMRSLRLLAQAFSA